jgi:UDP-galactopyranose mutase
MFENMLGHPNIKVLLNTDYREVMGYIPFKELVYTGPVDEFFDYCYGKLPYRSLEFRHETHQQPVYQPAPVVNYPNEYEYTRITEFKYLTGQEHGKTSIVFEYPRAEGDPYYPIPKPDCRELYRKYKAMADETPGVYFVGRLATYQYYNMDQVTAQALAMFKRIVTGQTATVAGATAEAPPARARTFIRPATPAEVVAPTTAPAIITPKVAPNVSLNVAPTAAGVTASGSVAGNGRVKSVESAIASGTNGSAAGAGSSATDYSSTRSTPKNDKLR